MPPRHPSPPPQTWTSSPLFPVALGRVQLAPDPLATASQLQALQELRGSVTSNPDPACAWTGDLNGVWRLRRYSTFAPLIAAIAGHARAYLQGVGFDPARVALHSQRCWPVLSEAGQTVGRHHHPNTHLSAVDYLNGDGSGHCGCLRIWPHRPPNELVSRLPVGHGGPLDPLDPAHALQRPGSTWRRGPACSCCFPPASITRCWRTGARTTSAAPSAWTLPSPHPLAGPSSQPPELKQSISSTRQVLHSTPRVYCFGPEAAVWASALDHTYS